VTHNTRALCCFLDDGQRPVLVGAPLAASSIALPWLAATIPSAAAHPLATVNAALNASATVLLVVGYVLIRQRRELAHKAVMLAAFGVSVAFLISYLAYHVWPVGAASTPFRGTGGVRTVYFAILISHIVLAAAVPFLAGWTIVLGLRDLRPRHRRLARWTLPIWLYVSVTGVVIYAMLYHLYPQP
jgi:uncharacterized membrane protein YozB (DUF420 family)